MSLERGLPFGHFMEIHSPGWSFFAALAIEPNAYLCGTYYGACWLFAPAQSGGAAREATHHTAAISPEARRFVPSAQAPPQASQNPPHHRHWNWGGGDRGIRPIAPSAAPPDPGYPYFPGRGAPG